MDGLYAPNIYRPFPYQRQSDDPYDPNADVSGPAMGLFGTGYFPDPMQPVQAQTQSAPDQRGGAGTDPNTSISGNINMTDISPDTQTTSVPMSTPPVFQTPTATPAQPPPYQPGPEQQRLKEMLQAGPRRSVLGTIANMAARGAAGYVNAARRTSVPVPDLSNLALRAPQGGPWAPTLKRQEALAGEEEAEQKEAQTQQQSWYQNQERLARAKELGLYGESLRQNAATRAEDLKDKVALRINNMLGNKMPRQIRTWDAAQPTPTDVAKGGWIITNVPGDPSQKMAVRPSPGMLVDPIIGKTFGAQPDDEGNYYLEPGQLNKYWDTVSKANELERRQNQDQINNLLKQIDEIRKQQATEQQGRHQTAMEDIATGLAADRAEAKRRDQELREQAASDAIDKLREQKINSAGVWAKNERDKAEVRDGIVTPQEEDRISREKQRQIQAAYDAWGTAIRRRGGNAADFVVTPDGGVYQSTESYSQGEKPVPIGTAPTPTPAPSASPAALTGPEPIVIPGHPPKVSFGGQAPSSVPPPVATGGGRGAPQQPQKTISKALVQKWADEHKKSFSEAAGVFNDDGYAIQP